MTRKCPHCHKVSDGWMSKGEGAAMVYFCPLCYKLVLPKDGPVVKHTDAEVLDFLGGTFGVTK